MTNHCLCIIEYISPDVSGRIKISTLLTDFSWKDSLRLIVNDFNTSHIKKVCWCREEIPNQLIIDVSHLDNFMSI